MSCISQCFQCFDAVGWVVEKAIWPVENCMVRYWHGYLFGARYRFSYGPADATALLVELLDLLEPALQASKLGFQVNWKKTVVQSMNVAQGCPSSITDGSETVAYVDQFTYLSSTIDSNVKSEPEICRLITVAKSAMQQMYISQYGTPTFFFRPNYAYTTPASYRSSSVHLNAGLQPKPMWHV